MIVVRPVTHADAGKWLRLRCALWPGDADGHAREIEQFFAGRLRNLEQVLMAVDASGRAVGFAELSIRNCAEGCSTDRVAYLEGWFVAPDVRRQGIGRALVESAERWAREQGCTEFGSDTTIDNTASARAHEALGFTETEQLRCFRKPLEESR